MLAAGVSWVRHVRPISGVLGNPGQEVRRSLDGLSGHGIEATKPRILRLRHQLVGIERVLGTVIGHMW